MLRRRFVHVGKTLTDLQILGCELHQNAFGDRGPAGGAIALYCSPDILAVIRGSEGRLIPLRMNVYLSALEMTFS